LSPAPSINSSALSWRNTNSPPPACAQINYCHASELNLGTLANTGVARALVLAERHARERRKVRGEKRERIARLPAVIELFSLRLAQVEPSLRLVILAA